MLQAQSDRELNLWQPFHEIAKESSKIVPLGAPFLFVPATGSFLSTAVAQLPLVQRHSDTDTQEHMALYR
jgi:hypothetical protein